MRNAKGRRAKFCGAPFNRYVRENWNNGPVIFHIDGKVARLCLEIHIVPAGRQRRNRDIISPSDGGEYMP